MRALVTGGSGFIGSNLVDALVARGDQVSVIDNLSTGRRENLDGAIANGAELHEVDVRDADEVSAVVAKATPEVIFHMAAQIDVRKSAADPMNDMQVNVGGTINVLEAARGA
ncbi:MAG TPA: SDR family NAD(P)-dependent oxidoreductase, partial [Thermoleophilaceae bacterium]|nr:SDR family NAD(P)-dependent oxidoreductase [Thermoleophilaceae bacterium]